MGSPGKGIAARDRVRAAEASFISMISAFGATVQTREWEQRGSYKWTRGFLAPL